MKSFVEIDKKNNGNYLKLLSVTAKLSKLFSESSVPYIYYRAAENIFCRSFNANNLSRSDTAFDANFLDEDLENLGIGLKTFMCANESSLEKVAEFNQLSKQLRNFQEKELAIKLSEFRNERINLAKRLYNIKNSVYHIVARKHNELLLFETDYKTINIENISSVKQKDTSLQFEDGENFYSYNFSKSTLFRKFIIPQNAFSLPIDIIEDPYSLLLDLFSNGMPQERDKEIPIKGESYVVLPLYGYKNNEKFVFEKSGLNQWNAGGRKRNIGEVYIPVPIEIHKKYPNFFPSRYVEFSLEIPTGETFNAKLCQENSKALMTNPNKVLSDWLLRKLFSLKEGEIATMNKLNELGFDSVIITKKSQGSYSIDKSSLNSYETFINE